MRGCPQDRMMGGMEAGKNQSCLPAYPCESELTCEYEYVHVHVHIYT